jgi:putative ABC transport system permease protein
VLKVLGATRRTIAASFLVEYGLMGLVGGAIAAVLGTLIAWLLVTGPLDADWHFAPAPLTALLGAAVAVTMALGFAGTWRVLGASAAPQLRHE